MRFYWVFAAALGVALICGSTAATRLAAADVTPSSEAKAEKATQDRPSVKLNTKQTKTPRRFWASWPYGTAVARPWPYIYPYSNYRNYWVQWNVPAFYRDPNRDVIYGYGYPYFLYQTPYPYSGHHFPYGL